MTRDEAIKRARETVLKMNFHPVDCAKGWDWVTSQVVTHEKMHKDAERIADALQQAAADEREACALAVVYATPVMTGGWVNVADATNAIRARGAK